MTSAATRADAIRCLVDTAEVRHLRIVGTLPGLLPLAAAGANGPGVARLRANGDGSRIQYRAPGSTAWGPETEITADGVYLLEDAAPAKWLRVQAYLSYLPDGPDEVLVYLGDRYANGPPSDDIDAAEAAAGDVETWTVSLQNDSGANVAGLTVWLDGAVQYLELSADGSTWVAPTDFAAGLDLGDLAPAAAATLHLRRTIPAGTSADPAVLVHLHVAYTTTS